MGSWNELDTWMDEGITNTERRRKNIKKDVDYRAERNEGGSRVIPDLF